MIWDMPHLRILPHFLMAGLLLAGCSEGKLNQCDKLRIATNETVSAVKELHQHQGDVPSDEQMLIAMADTLDRGAVKLNDVDLDDTTLQDFRQRYIITFTEITKATRDLLAAYDDNDLEMVNQAIANLQEAIALEVPLVEAFEQYCKGA